MAIIEFVMIFTVTSLDLPVVSWGIGSDKLVPDIKFYNGFFKQCKPGTLA